MKEIDKKKGNMANQFMMLADSYNSTCFIAESDLSKGAKIKGNASVSFINTGSFCIAITNWHVLDFFRKEKEKSLTTIFQIGNIKLDPDKYLIDQNVKQDLACLNLESFDNNKLGAIYCSSTRVWPPPRVEEGDVVIYSGYPNNFVNQVNISNVHSSSVQFLGFATSVSENRIALQYDLSKSEIKSYAQDMKNFNTLGGFSGSLVLKLDDSHTIAKLISVGITYEGSSSLQLQFARHIDLVNEYGKIQ